MNRFIEWCRENRNTTRIAFLLQVGTRLGSSLFGLLWTRLLVRAMGDSLYGMFVSFQSLASLGGLGDLGLGGVISLQVGRHLGQGTHDELKSFLALARAVFLSLTLGALILGTALSPWLPRWLGFDQDIENAGSITVLFVLGGMSAALLIVSSYISSVSYAVGNITWPVLPAFIITQAGLALHWLAARSGASLSVQYVAYVLTGAISVLMVWGFVRISHPELAKVFPLKFDGHAWLGLFRQSIWAYLWGLGYLIYTTTDRLLINAGFGSKQVGPYYLNTKLCELALSFVITAGFVSLPKLTIWLASSKPAERARALREIARLNNVQSFLGCAAALVYLAINDSFITLWIGPHYHVPLSWQWAFALNLAITASGAAVMQLASRCGENGLRVAGAAVGVTGAMNLVLSFAAMKLGSIWGIALATVAAQSFFSLYIGHFVCRHLNAPFLPWLFRNWVLPVLVVCAGYGLCALVPPGPAGVSIEALGLAGLLGFTAWLTDMNLAFVREEWQIVRSKFGR